LPALFAAVAAAGLTLEDSRERWLAVLVQGLEQEPA